MAKGGAKTRCDERAARIMLITLGGYWKKYEQRKCSFADKGRRLSCRE